MLERRIYALFGEIYWILIPVVVLGCTYYAVSPEEFKEFLKSPTISMCTFLFSGLAVSKSEDLKIKFRIFFYVNITIFIISLMLSILIAVGSIELFTEFTMVPLYANVALLALSIVWYIITGNCSY